MDVTESIERGKLVVVFFEIDLIEETVSSINGADLMATESLDEPVLMSTVGSLNASLGLGRMSQDHANA